MKTRNYILILIGLISLCLSTKALSNTAVNCNGHPRILGDGTQYAALQAKATASPWQDMKIKAQFDANNHSYQYSTYWGGTNQGYAYYCFRYKDVLSSLSLSYILDPANQNFYVSKATSEMLNGLQYLIDNRPSGWSGNVPFSGALFETILALDIMYCDLDASAIALIENMISSHVYTLQGWEPAPTGCRGLWAIYNGDMAQTLVEKDAYKQHLLSLFSDDGVFLSGGDYADARMLEGDRYTKHIFMDILEIQGFNEFYTEPKLVNGHEWIMGYASTPFNRTFGFGDSAIKRNVARDDNDLATYRVSKFSATAQNYARYKSNNYIPRPNLLAYILCESPAYTQSTPELAPSRIFPDGGAWFHEDRQATDILAGAIWNPKAQESHQHFDVNAISLAAYDEVLLTNSGYNGWGTSVGNYSWDYIHNRALSGNTALIDYPITDPTLASTTNNHVEKFGNGIVQGFTSDYLDFSCGDSGAALPNGQHFRNFMFVHPANGKEGYWILIDKIKSDNAGSQGHLALHPFSNNITTNTANEDYTWTIQEYGNQPVYLSIHLGTNPDQVQEFDGVVGLGNNGVKDTRFLYNTYAMDANKERNIVSILQPHKVIGDKPNWARINGNSFEGTAADLGNGVIDYAIGSEDDANSQTFQNHTFTAESTVFRTINNSTEWYFVKNGTTFNETGSNYGFSSDNPITISMNNTNGQLIATTTTTVQLGFGNLNNCFDLLVDGTLQSFTTNSDNTIEFAVNGGQHSIEIIIDNTIIAGTTCDDNDPCTINDIYGLDCNCVGVFQDADGDGICDVNDVCPNGDDTIDLDNDGIPDACDNCNIGAACDDNDPCTTGDVYDANCTCIGTFQDADGDGVCDADDLCPNADDTIDNDNNGVPDACEYIPVWLEAECGVKGSTWSLQTDTTASHDEFMMVTSGYLGAPPTTSADVISYSFNISQAGAYKIWGRTMCDIASEDSFWIQVDNDNWIRWNGVPHSTTWQWDDVHDSDDNYSTEIFNFSTGTHTLNLAFRESGAKIDKLHIALATDTPMGEGGTDLTCTNAACNLIGLNCDDNDPCTTSDVYDANCNCIGVFQDADSDGICDINDICPNGDDTIDVDANGIPDACDLGDVWLEAECGVKGNAWTLQTDTTASHDEFMTVTNGYLGTPPTTSADMISYTFTINQTGIYKVWGRTMCQIASEDSFWIQMDNDVWIRWNGVPHSATWQWDDVHDSDNNYSTVIYNLTAGTHTLNLAFRESGAKIDKLYIAPTTETPTGAGGFDPTCPTGCNLVGLSCDDNDACTTGDIYDSNCDCIGVFADADGDTVCDVDDLCPNADDLVDTNSNGIPDACDNSTATWIEAECGTVGGTWLTLADTTAGEETYVKVDNGFLGAPPVNAYDMISYTFTINQVGTYKIWGRTICSTSSEDSFWIQVDNDNWIRWNGVPHSTIWQWDDVHDSDDNYNTELFNLSIGTHTLNLAWRERDAQIDKFYIDLASETPTGIGGVDLTCMSAACNLTGQPCDDNDSCTIADTYDANCDCIGLYQDTDADGVCDADDICPNGDDTIDSNLNAIPDACEVAFSEIWLEAECGEQGSNWLTATDTTASDTTYVIVQDDYLGVPPTDSADQIIYDFYVGQTGYYKVWGRTICEDKNEDSFWIQMDNNNWIRWNGVPHSTTWQWDDVHDSDNGYNTVIYYLIQGNHSLKMGWREGGAEIDKFYIAEQSFTPSGIGGVDTTCVNSIPFTLNSSREKGAIAVFPNPSTGTFYANASAYIGELLSFHIYDILGREQGVIHKEKIETDKIELDFSDLDEGVYFIQFRYKKRIFRSQKVVITKR